MFQLTNEAVALYPLDSAYIDKLRAWRNHPDVRRWCRQYKLISDRDQAQWFQRQNDDNSIEMLAVAFNEKIVGVCGLTDIDLINRRAEFSLYIAPEFQKNGYGRSALKTLLWHGFNDLGLNRIWGETFDGNPAMDLFTQMGFVAEGTRKEHYYRDGNFIDCHLISCGRPKRV